MQMCDSKLAPHHNCCHSSKQDCSVSLGTWHGWATPKTLSEPYICRFAGWPGTGGAAQDVHVMRPDSVPDLGAIQIIYLLTYLLTYLAEIESKAVRVLTSVFQMTSSELSSGPHAMTCTLSGLHAMCDTPRWWPSNDLRSRTWRVSLIHVTHKTMQCLTRHADDLQTTSVVVPDVFP